MGGSTKKFNIRHYWMSTEKKSYKKCTACGCLRYSVTKPDRTYTHYELNGELFIGEPPPCKHLYI